MDDELESLRAQNLELAEQVKDLVRLSSRLYGLQEELERQQRLYKSMTELGRELIRAESTDAIFEMTCEYILYQLEFERVMILLREDVDQDFALAWTDGIYDDDEIARLRATRPWLADGDWGEALIDGARLLRLHSKHHPNLALQGFVEQMGMRDAFVMPLRGAEREVLGVVVIGNAPAAVPYHTRVDPEEEALVVAQSLRAVLSSVLREHRARAEGRRALRAADEARARAELASLAKSRFLANMSHELRTPLTSILGYAELLEEELEDVAPQAGQDLERIHTAGSHLLSLINDILDLSKIEAGSLVLDISTFDLTERVGDIVESVRPQAVRRGNQVRLEIRARGRVTTDALRLQQILLNLLSNATKFTQDGEIYVRVGIEGGWLVLEVEDTGIGMSPEVQSRIFEPFEQADSSTSRLYEGTGLGLSICVQLVGLLGGHIALESAPGVGTTFTVRWPLSEPDLEFDGDAEEE